MAINRSPKGRVETRVAAPCPGCGGPLSISYDMWGPFWFCESCGFSTEDDAVTHKAEAAPEIEEIPARDAR